MVHHNIVGNLWFHPRQLSRTYSCQPVASEDLLNLLGQFAAASSNVLKHVSILDRLLRTIYLNIYQQNKNFCIIYGNQFVLWKWGECIFPKKNLWNSSLQMRGKKYLETNSKSFYYRKNFRLNFSLSKINEKYKRIEFFPLINSHSLWSHHTLIKNFFFLCFMCFP